jgi:mannose-1-phosphate guanylyltransferase/mannose-6-phosphate isomerase
MTAQRIIPVLMCGGAGTRMWPVSRESMPKQFVPLFGERSTFQQTLERVGDLTLFDRPIVITNRDFRFIAAEQVRELGIEADVVIEPSRRDSGPAVAAAAALAARRSPDAIVLVLAADHLVRKRDSFVAACREAAVAAAEGRIVTFGIVPTEPATSYGYIRPGAVLNGGAARTVEAFVEKPDAQTASRYVAEHYLWNSGNFMFRADVMMAEIERLEPVMAQTVREAVAGLTHDLDFQRLAADPFTQAPRKSIDYAVMERTTLAAVVPADMGWSDIGSWDSVWNEEEHDAQGNALSGSAVVLDSRNSLVRAEDGVLTAVVGLDDVVVVTTGDAVLVASRHKTEQVKTLVEMLKAQNRREAVEHKRVYRPWGFYQGVDQGGRYQVKRITVYPGQRLSLQKHFHRAEHWVVVKGTAEITLGDDIRTVHENESVYIPVGGVHRLANPGKILLELIEVQVGSYLGEDDIVRLDDVYGRG